jgi:Fe-S-cluster containining protein
MCRVNVDKTKIYRVSNIINNNYSTKINKIINIINSSNTKFIIFTQYEKLIKKLHDILEQVNISNITFNDYPTLQVKDDKNYNLEWCEHFDQKNLKCNIYDTRPDGCRRYPDVNTFLKERWLIPGCSYYLEEDVAIT